MSSNRTTRKRAAAVLATVVTLLSTACAPPQVGPSPAAGAPPMGLQLYSLRDSFPASVPRTLAWVRAQGFRDVELAGTYGMAPAAFRAELARHGLTASAMHVGYNRLQTDLEGALDEAKALGVTYVGTASIPRERGVRFSVAHARESAANFNRWGRAARARGLRFFYHNHGFEWEPGTDGVAFDVLMQETDPAYVDFEMDVFWTVLPGQDPVALLRKYPGRFKLMHVKDMRKDYATPNHGGGAPAEAKVAIGSGKIDFPAIFRVAREVGVEKFYLEDETVAPYVNIPASLRYLETVR